MSDFTEETIAEGADDTAEVDATDVPDDDGIEQDDTTADDQPRYTIKVNGEEVEVTLDELQNGYQRQSDYTKKTQELASERERLAAYQTLDQMLESDPARAIELLTDMYGIGPAESDVEDDLDPNAREIQELKQWKEQQEQQVRLQNLRSEARDAITAHKLTGTEEDLISFAHQENIFNLNTAARLMAADQRSQDSESNRAKATDAKRQAGSLVNSGAGRSGSATAAPSKMSFRDAVNRAYQHPNG